MDSESLSLFEPQEAERHEEITSHLARMRVDVDALTVTSDREAHSVHAVLADCKLAERMAEDVRKRQVEPLNAQVKAINAAWRPISEAVSAVEAACKRKLLAWQQSERERVAREQAAARRAQEEAARKQAEAEARAATARTQAAKEKAQAEAAAADQALMQARLAEPTEAPRGFRSDAGLTSTRRVWRFEVTDREAVPRPYLTPDMKALRAAVTSGVRDIPGVTIWEDEQLSVRIG